MAGFKTHITTSTVLGVGYATAGYSLGAPLATSMLAGGLCSVSGMLPDLDSDSGIPVRESVAFLAAIVPMLMVERLQRMELPMEAIVLAGGLIYIAIRFGLAAIFKHYTVHRGMWHSIPAAIIASALALLLCTGDDYRLRVFDAGAVFLGFMSHLVLDEIWSIEMKGGRIRLKKSSGTALKFWGKSLWGNISTYVKLAAVVVLVAGDDAAMEYLQVEPHTHQQPTSVAHQLLENEDLREAPRTARQMLMNFYDEQSKRWR